MVAKKRVRNPNPKANGRPTVYTEELAKEICDAIASSNEGLQALCEQHPHWPTRACIFLWMRRYPGFFDLYTRAKEQQAEVQVDYMLAIANEPHHYIDPETGAERIDSSMLRIKMDAIKWQASKLAQKRFGDKTETIVTNPELLQDSLERKNKLDEKNKKEY